MAQVQAPAYDKHVKIRPRPVRGRFQTLRKTALFTLLLGFQALPFLQWGHRQAVWFDLAHQRFYIFSLNIWPQDFILLTFILMGLALVLFFCTALMGRVWCGYACPQTVYTEVFLWIEQAIEGNRSEQLKLTRAPWHREKILKRVGKYGAWVAFAIFTGFGFVGYFYPIRHLIPDFFTGRAGVEGYFWVLFYGGFCYMQAGIVREKFCKFMCPYARFQGAMFDRDTLIIAYDEKRGEPRRRLKRQDRDSGELGFCVDCTMCVQVCPTGIDIRNGLQLECIACAACIDACNNMMDQINAPRGLIRYTSTNALEGKHTHLLRPKTFVYGLVLSVAFVLFIYALITKTDLDINALHDRNVLARDIGNGELQNIYNIQVMNKTERRRSYTLSVSGIEGAKLDGERHFTIPASQVYAETVRVNAPIAALHLPSQPVYFILRADDNPKDQARAESKFLKIITP